MAKTPFITSIGANFNSNSVVPSGKYFVGALYNKSSTGSLTIAGVGIPPASSSGVSILAPLVIPGGATITSSSNYTGCVLTGFLYDN